MPSVALCLAHPPAVYSRPGVEVSGNVVDAEESRRTELTRRLHSSPLDVTPRDESTNRNKIARERRGPKAPPDGRTVPSPFCLMNPSGTPIHGCHKPVTNTHFSAAPEAPWKALQALPLQALHLAYEAGPFATLDV